jgi:hypothetical protein
MGNGKSRGEAFGNKSFYKMGNNYENALPLHVVSS